MGWYRSVVLVMLLLLTPMTPIASAQDAPTVSITTDWSGSSALSNEHAYILTFGDSSAHDYDLTVQHVRDAVDLVPSIQTTFLEAVSYTHLTLPTTSMV